MVQTKQTLGIGYLLFAHVAFTVMVCLIRLAQVENSGVTALFRFTIGVMSVVALSFTGKITLVFNNKAGLLWRGLLGGIAIGLGFLGITKLGIIKASMIINSYPLFATLFGSIILKEKIDKVTMIAMLFAFSGLLLVMSGDGALSFSFDTYSILTLLGAILGGLAVVQVKKLSQSESSSAIYVAQCIVGAAIMVIPAVSKPISLSQNALAMLIGMGIFATLGQLTFTEGMKHVKIATSSLLSMLGPILTVLAGVFLFKEPLTTKMLLGISISLLAIGSFSIKKRKCV